MSNGLHPFLEELRNGLRHCGVTEERVLVAVSGGADSVALLCGLVELSSEFSLKLSIAHLNHRLRGADSDADANWVCELASSFKLPCEVGVISVSESSIESKGVEERARNLRYRFLDETAVRLNCRTIALAHTAGDQAETVLHRLLRGTGLTGLRGMLSERQTEAGNRLIRPMLAIRRNLLEDYLRDRSQSFRTDATNLDTTMTRNRLRHVILPMLREQINPKVDIAIFRLAEQAADIEDFVKPQVEQLLSRTLKDSQPESCWLDVSELADQSRYLVCELFREVWQLQQWPMQAMGYEQWTRLVDTIHSRETITLPNRIEARYHSGTLLVLRRL
jgi:tRNA(Ile)-lysidine synthase